MRVLWVSVTTAGLTWARWFGHFPFGFPPGSGSGEATWSAAVVGALIGALGGAALAVAQWLYIRSVFVPAEGRCECLFEAPDPATVREVNDTAGLPYRRVIEALDLTP